MTESSTDTLSRPSEGSDALERLRDSDAAANLAVKDLDRAKRFYEETLGFAPVHVEGGELIVYKSGGTVFNVYRSDFAGTNQATAMTWAVGDRLEDVARALAARGVRFEHYDLPGMRRDGDIHTAGDMKVAWFRDPDGNILNIVND